MAVGAMDDLLPHYERELAFLRQHAGEFAERHPKIAGRLMVSGDVGEDPHVERLIESFALLAARVHKRLDDDFPLFTESLLEVLYPHYLRPFPCCAIARLGAPEGSGSGASPVEVPRGTLLNSRAVRGVVCKFRTAADVRLLPVRVAALRFVPATTVPAGTPWPPDATARLSITLELSAPGATWEALASESLRLYLDGEASQVAALREALLGATEAVLLQHQESGAWAPLNRGVLRAVGFGDDEALLDQDARSHPAYRLLTEYFAFPDKFNFVDLVLPSAGLTADLRQITLHLALRGFPAGGDEARLLQTVSHRHLITGCTPVVNTFTQRAEPIRLSHTVSSHAVLPDARRAFGHEVWSVDRVYRSRQTPQGEQIERFEPLYSLQHAQLGAEGEAGSRYWMLHRDDELAHSSPGHETEISVVDLSFDPAAAVTDTLSLEVTATNRDLPTQLQLGAPGGDLFMAGGGPVREIRLLRRPSPCLRFDRGQGALWRLISHLSVNHLSLSGGGVDALKELLRLYDLPRSPVSRRVIESIQAVEHRPVTACLPGHPYPVFVRGTEIHLTVDESHFAGTGLRLFAQVLDHFFGLFASANSFTQLRVRSARTQEELLICDRRSGDRPLL
jgi:type VI secretion system protein ImpG